ncbi:MAG: desulfoferrodoxin [Clostridia bacterium]|nr:desulfoferrodoxin [Clostridia bacterium]
MKKLVIRECAKCGARVEVLKDCTCDDCGIKCCGETMKEVVPNTVDASIEKHKPVVEVIGNYIVVTVNHVMEEEHFIEYVCLVGDNVNAKKYMTIGGSAKAVFPYIKGSTVYAYCNKHGMWETVVE